MKAERINKNQVRFTLGAEDLESRNIQLSELSYGSEKAKALFHDMMLQAQQEFGFDFSSQPVMIEAVPLSSDSIMITVTKVHKPHPGDALIPSITTPLSTPRTDAGTPSSTDTPSSVPERYSLFGFSDFHTLRKAAALTPDKLNLKNCLYFDPGTNYYFIEARGKLSNPKIRYTMSLLLENAAEVYDNPLMSYYLHEHGQCLLKARALQKLKLLS